MEVVYWPPKCDCSIRQRLNGEIFRGCLKGPAIIVGNFNLHTDWTNKRDKGVVEECIDISRDSFFEQC